MEKQKFEYLKNIRKSFLNQKEGFESSIATLKELYNFNELKEEIIEENLELKLENLFYSFIYICILIFAEYGYNWKDIEVIIPAYNAMIEFISLRIKNNLNKIGYSEDDLLTKSLLNRPTISMIRKYIKLCKQNETFNKKWDLYSKGISMTDQLYKETTNDIIDTLCDIDKELTNYDEYILDCYKYKDDFVTKDNETKDSVKTYSGPKQSTIDVLKKYDLL